MHNSRSKIPHLLIGRDGVSRKSSILQTIRCLCDWDGDISFLGQKSWPSIFHLMFLLQCQHRLAVMWFLWKGRLSRLPDLTFCLVFLFTQTCFAALAMTGNMKWVIMQNSLVILTPPVYAPIVGKTICPWQVWSVKGHTVLCPRRVVTTASWPNFINVATTNTFCRLLEGIVLTQFLP